jgi:hypothetical protein
MGEPTLKWFEGYEVREGRDGRVGIYLTSYNVRLATFNANTHALQTRLKLLFDRANKTGDAKRVAKRPTTRRSNRDR